MTHLKDVPCKTCGEPFHPRTINRQFCSKKCYGLSMKGTKRGTYDSRANINKYMTDSDKRWIACALECEGSIFTLHKERKTPSLRLSITNTDYGFLEEIKKLSGVGSINDQMKEGAKNWQPHFKDSWHWTCNGGNAKALLKEIEPFLVMKDKKEKARFYLERD